MRWLGLGAVTVILLAPAPARQQAVTPWDLVGTWKGIIGVDPATETDESGQVILHAVVFRKDSTYTETWVSANGQGQRCQNGRLARLAGDTVSWAGGNGSFKVVLRNQRLAFYNWDNLSDPIEAYQRVDSTKARSVVHERLAACPTAQDQHTDINRRLTVRPREMATGTRTERAGEHELPPPAIQWTNAQAPAPAMVYVPPRCVGTRRCPLLVFAWTSDGENFMDYVRPMADKYGIILLSPGTRYYNLGGVRKGAAATEQERQHLDATLKQVLQQFAIDPDKIAIMGTCATGQVPVNIGGDNFDVFNRIISLSGAPSTFEEVDPPTPKVEFFFDAGIDESQLYFKLARAMRDKGYRVTHAFGLRVHGHQLESYDHVGRWLQKTWAPDPAARPAPSVVADPLPLLTTDVLAKMTAFWTRFVHEPDSIRMAGRKAHLRDVAVPVGKERPVVVMVDMAALAAAYPSVAAALKAAGLTAQEHDAYRVALASARALRNSAGDLIGTVDPASPQARNVAFMAAHPHEFAALEGARSGYARNDTMRVPANMWSMP